MIKVLNIFNIIVIQLQFLQSVQALEILNFPNIYEQLQIYYFPIRLKFTFKRQGQHHQTR